MIIAIKLTAKGFLFYDYTTVDNTNNIIIVVAHSIDGDSYFSIYQSVYGINSTDSSLVGTGPTALIVTVVVVYTTVYRVQKRPSFQCICVRTVYIVYN